MSSRSESVLTLVLISFLLLGCKAVENLVNKTAGGNTNTETAKSTNTSRSNTEEVAASEDGTIPSGTGTEKEKPSAGKANVQGKAFFNDKPAAGVDVKLCKTFNRFFGGCSGETFTAKTDDTGEYLIKNVTPGVYEGLTVKVFNTPYYVFATSGVIAAAKYDIQADKTYFAPDTNLFKNDLKIAAPKAGAKVAPENIEVKWNAYPDAEYYQISIFADSTTGAETPYTFIDKRIDGIAVTVDTPLKAGTYTLKVEAFNANDNKLAQSSDDMKFSVK